MTLAARARRDTGFRPGTAGPTPVEQPGLATILALLGVFVATWALYFTVTESMVAIKHDMAEAYAWGRQFELGYHQHPPFWAWICGLWFRVFPRSGWAFALLSSLNAGIGLWGAWMAIGEFAAGSRRGAAWALLLLTPLYTFYAYRYDANIIFLSIWPWTLYCFMRSVERRGLRDAVWFGVCVGLALMSKYYAVILLAACFLAVLQHPARRSYFGSASPYVAAAVAAAICAPHIWWLATHRAPPLRYLDSRLDWPWHRVLADAAKAVVGVIGMNLGVVLVVAVVSLATRAGGRAASGRDARDPTLRVLAALTLTPLVLTAASALVLRTPITAEMMIGTFPLLPLLVIELAGLRETDRLFRVAARLAAVLMFGALAVSPAFAWWRTYRSPPAMKFAPFQEVAVVATKIWHERTSLPLMYVGGSPWYGNETAFYSPDRPHAFELLKYSVNLWVTPEKIAQHGLLSICISTDKVCLAATARFATPRTTRTEISLAQKAWGHVARPVRYVVTVIPPRD